MRQHFDFLVMVDPRLPESDDSAFAGLLGAMLERGSSVGLLSVLGPLAEQRRFLPRALARLLCDGSVRWLATPGPVAADILLVYHLSPLLADPDRITRIEARRCFLRVEQPLDDRIDLAAVLERLRWFCPQQPELLATDDAVLSSLKLQTPRTIPACSLPEAAIDGDGSSFLAAALPPAEHAQPQLRVRAIEQARARVLMVSPNGVGIGHLTRQLAIARRLPAAVEPVFFSMSQAVHLVERFGMGWTYAPGPSASGVAEERRWTPDFAQRLVDTVAFLDPRVIVFDGNHPYQALRNARQHFRDRMHTYTAEADPTQDVCRNCHGPEVPSVDDSVYLEHAMTSRVSRVAMDAAERAVNNGQVYGEVADAQRDQLCSSCHGGTNLLPAVSCDATWRNHLIQGRVSEVVWEDISAPLGGCGW